MFSGSPSQSTTTIWPGLQLVEQDPLGQRVLDLALDGAAQRPGTQHRVVALLRQELLGVVGQLQAHVLVAQLSLDPRRS